MDIFMDEVPNHHKCINLQKDYTLMENIVKQSFIPLVELCKSP